MFWLAGRGVDLKLVSASETPEHLRDFSGFSLVDVVFLTVLIDIVDGFDVDLGLTVFDVFGHD